MKLLGDKLKESQILLSDEYIENESLLDIKQGCNRIPLFRRQNISTIVGGAKSRKTFFTTLISAALLHNGLFQNKFLASKNKILFIDTEQAKADTHKIIKRICALNNFHSHPENLHVYCLRRWSVLERRALIEVAIEEIKPSFVIIDGVRDLVTDINNPDQATEITSMLMRISLDYNCHILNVIHYNKADKIARGHIGTELMNKSETVISVTKEKNCNLSTVSAEYMRGLEFEPFLFEIKNGLPIIDTSHKIVQIQNDEVECPF